MYFMPDSPLTTVGVLRKSGFLGPTPPDEISVPTPRGPASGFDGRLLPQHLAVPSVRVAQVKSLLADTLTAPAMFNASCGVGTGAAEGFPSPSCPTLDAPRHLIVSSVAIAQAWESPAATCFALKFTTSTPAFSSSAETEDYGAGGFALLPFDAEGSALRPPILRGFRDVSGA